LPQENYRFFCLDAFGQLHGPESFYADCDDAAIAQVRAKHPGGKCEIWQEQRLVARLGLHDWANPIVQSRRALQDSRGLLRETAHMTQAGWRSDPREDAR